jgi:putative RNA 2'-phosphotransferase
MDYVKLSKRMSKVLRHTPWEYELELDEEGWVPLEHLLAGLRSERALTNVQITDLQEMMKNASKARFEMEGERVRALYGHSVPGKLKKEAATPPEILYHGTAARFIQQIRQEGLKPMRRQYVHFSVDTHMATLVGARKGSEIILLQIRAKEAAENGVAFYIGNEQVWLADSVPAHWITFPT